jgi:hypothetical protein
MNRNLNAGNIADRFKQFTQKIEQDANRHIYFNDSSDDTDEDNEEGELNDKPTKTNSAQNTNPNYYTLTRSAPSDSFGFEVNGKKNVPGDHKISHININSIAQSCGLKVNEKIKLINGVCVDNMTIDQLIDCIQAQTAINPLKIELYVTQVSDSDKLTVDNRNSLLRKRNLCKTFELVFFPVIMVSLEVKWNGFVCLLS